MTVIIAVANQKGGVGKTTTAINMSAYIAARDHRVLLVDLDPQANASSALGYRTGEAPSVHDVLVRGIPVREVLIRTRTAGLDLLPSSSGLVAADLELAATLGREFKLRRALADIRDRYDHILIDCPPNLGLLTVNAFMASAKVLAPVQCEYLALEGLSELAATVELIRNDLNPQLSLAAILMTMYDARTSLSREVVEEVRRHFPEALETVIPRNVRLAEAPSHGQTIREYAPSSAAARSYEAAAGEFLAVIGS